jgi:hypothetical protein
LGEGGGGNGGWRARARAGGGGGGGARALKRTAGVPDTFLPAFATGEVGATLSAAAAASALRCQRGSTRVVRFAEQSSASRREFSEAWLNIFSFLLCLLRCVKRLSL